MVPRAVLMKSGLVSVNTARQVNRVNTVKDKNVNTVKPKAVVNAARLKAVVNAIKGNNVNVVKASACWVWKPKTKVLDHVFLLGYKGENYGILEFFITGVENLIINRITVIRTPHQNGVAERENRTLIEAARTMLADSKPERRNRTLIEAARTMLADSKLPTTFWAEAVNTACYVQNRVKAFRVLNSRTRIVEESLHIRFSESTPNVVGSGPDWVFDIDALTRTMNYEPIVAGTQSNGLAGTKASDNEDPKSSHDDGFKPSSDDEKKVNEDPRIESESEDQEKEDNVNKTKNVNAASTNEVNVVGAKTSIELPVDPNMPALEDYSIFDLSSDDQDNGADANINNLNITIQVSPIPPTRIHKDHHLNQVIRDLQSATQTRNMLKNLEEHGFVSTTLKQRTNHKDLQNCLFACFLSQEEPKKVIHALKDPSWIEEGIDYDELFAPVARIEAIRLFLAYASFKDFVVYQMDVKSAFLYGKIEEEVYVCQPPRFEDPNFLDKVYKVEKALYRLHQAPRAWYETSSTYMLDNEFQRGKIDKTLFTKRYKGDILLV
ncbi:putative ribonuclease H-like domain-containing protein [Tanacetum coccineum]